MERNSAGKIRTVVLDLGNVLVFHDNARLARNLAAATGTTVSDVEGWAGRNNEAITIAGDWMGPGARLERFRTSSPSHLFTTAELFRANLLEWGLKPAS